MAHLKQNPIISGLLDYLNETGETGVLPELSKELEMVAGKQKEAEEIVITSAVALSDLQKTKILQILKSKLNQDLPVLNLVDKTVLGGFVVRAGDWFLDASLLSELNHLGRILKA